MDPCRGAHKLYWMASVPVEDPVHIELARRREAFAILADESEQLPLSERKEIRQKVV